MATLTYTDVLQIVECGACHISFAIPKGMYREVSQDGSWFWCPRGCKIHYGEFENARLKAQLDQAQADARWHSDRRVRAERLAEHERRSAIALKGHLTRMRKRIANGVCPVPGCKRSGFEKVMAHIATQHKDWLAEHPEIAAGG